MTPASPESVQRLKTTLLQMDRLLAAVDDLQRTVLPQDPHLFASLVEAPLENLGRLRDELRSTVPELRPAI